MKHCTVCKQLKEDDAFYRRKAGGLYSSCKKCDIARRSAWTLNNPERVRAQQNTWRVANQDHVTRRQKTSRKANPEKSRAHVAKWRAANTDAARAAVSVWRKANKAYGVAMQNAREAAKIKATPKWADKAAISAMYAEAQRTGMQVDHVVPLRSKWVCGLHTPANLQLLTPHDNAVKGNHHWPDMPIKGHTHGFQP
jgi:hypothetical protein